MLKVISFIVSVCMGFSLVACAGKPPAITIPKTEPKPPALVMSPRVVLVLGGGGARGYAHIGALQALQEAKIPIDAITCASAGCIVGALFADNKSAKKTFDDMIGAGFFTFADVANFPSLGGIVKGYHLEKFLLTHMTARTFSALKIRLIVATTDLLTGHTFVISGGPVAPAVLASAALPGIVLPPHLYGRTLVDGGVSDPVPVDLAKALHPKMIIAIDLSHQLSTHVPVAALNIYNRAYEIVWRQLTDHSLVGADLVISPGVGDIGMFDLGDKYQMYLMGYNATKKAIPKIKALLRSKGLTR